MIGILNEGQSAISEGQSTRFGPRRVSPFSSASHLGYEFLLRCCESDFPDHAELHMLLGMPEIVVVLHGKPTFRRTAKRL